MLASKCPLNYQNLDSEENCKAWANIWDRISRKYAEDPQEQDSEPAEEDSTLELTQPPVGKDQHFHTSWYDWSGTGKLMDIVVFAMKTCLKKYIFHMTGGNFHTK